MNGIMETGTVVRVVDALPQDWGADFDNRRAEEALLRGFLGKAGRVVDVDGFKPMPFIVRFGEAVRVPFREFRFRGEELGEVQA